MSGPLHVSYEGPDGRILVTDSLTYCDERLKVTDVVVGGSFAGAYPVALALRRGARAVIANAAGVGKDGAGISGLSLGDEVGAACAAVSEATARLADGPDVYQHGVVEHINDLARQLGVEPGMDSIEAAQRLLKAPQGRIGRAAGVDILERGVLWEGPEGRVSALASVGLARPEDAGNVICAGSHTGLVTWRYVVGYGFPVAGIICNDAGLGKDRSGIAGLEPLADAGVAAAAVAHTSARIGDAASTFADGVISFANAVAERAGIQAGLPAREAALIMLRAARGGA